MQVAGRSEPAVTPVPGQASDDRVAFERFVKEAGPRLSRALAAAYAWENWQELRHVANLAGYLFRVGQTRSRRKRQPVLFDVGGDAEHGFEPGLPKALAALSQRQRLAVVLVHGYDYTLREVAELMGIKPTTVQNHLDRGLLRLRSLLGADDEN
jgi:DNA-directed RNA polymerase specialized sigma24 family protein